ncbi:MAG: glycosyltransferase [Gammaproteobacteria bacterium]|nr:glycosyltransferase [Gammaproteobacteria bacterium]
MIARSDIAVLIPCYNEEVPIPQVIAAFRHSLPEAKIYVYDNNSSDKTIEVAKAAGAIVRSEKQQGKGNVVRRMFADVEADIYVLVDGDNTYEAGAAPQLVEKLVNEQLDMVYGCRVTEIKEAYRRGHRLGNKILTGLVARIFGRQTKDMLSGYRVFSRRFVKSFPSLSRGFEIETELTIHASELRLPTADVDTVYINRLPGSSSKLSTYRDGFRILRLITKLMKEERPFALFGTISAILYFLCLIIGLPVFAEYFATGLVPRLPSAVLAASIAIIATFTFFSGLTLQSITLARREQRRLAYLSVPPFAPKNQ